VNNGFRNPAVQELCRVYVGPIHSCCELGCRFTRRDLKSSQVIGIARSRSVIVSKLYPN